MSADDKYHRLTQWGQFDFGDDLQAKVSVVFFTATVSGDDTLAFISLYSNHLLTRPSSDDNYRICVSSLGPIPGWRHPAIGKSPA